MVEADLERAEERAEAGEKYIYVIFCSSCNHVRYKFFCHCLQTTLALKFTYA